MDEIPVASKEGALIEALLQRSFDVDVIFDGYVEAKRRVNHDLRISVEIRHGGITVETIVASDAAECGEWFEGETFTSASEALAEVVRRLAQVAAS